MVVIPLYLTNSRKYCHFGAISPPNRIVGNARLLWVLKRLKRASASSFSLLTPSNTNTTDLRRAASSELLPIQEAWVQIGRKWAVAATGSSSNSRRQQQSKHIDFGDQDSSKQASNSGGGGDGGGGEGDRRNGGQSIAATLRAAPRLDVHVCLYEGTAIRLSPCLLSFFEGS